MSSFSGRRTPCRFQASIPAVSVEKMIPRLPRFRRAVPSRAPQGPRLGSSRTRLALAWYTHQRYPQPEAYWEGLERWESRFGSGIRRASHNEARYNLSRWGLFQRREKIQSHAAASSLRFVTIKPLRLRGCARSDRQCSLHFASLSSIKQCSLEK